MAKDKIPPHIELKIWESIQKGIPYSIISEQMQVAKSSITRVKTRMEKKLGITPEAKDITTNEMKRREKIAKAAVAVQSYKRADLIAEGFVNAFNAIAYNLSHMVEIVEHSSTEANSIKEKQEEILKLFKELKQSTGDENNDASFKNLFVKLRESISKIDDFFARDMLRIKAVGELRKNLETFLKMRQEIQDIEAVKRILDAFFIATDELDDKNYKKYREKVTELAPVVGRWFHEQESTAISMEQRTSEGTGTN